MSRRCAIVIAVLLAFTASAYAKPSDWADVVETPSERARSMPKQVSTTKPAPKVKKKARAGKRVAVKPKAKAKKAKAKRR